VVGGHAVLTARAVGTVTVSNGAGVRSGSIVIRQPDAAVPEPRWILRPFDGHFSSVIWAASTWGASVDGNNHSDTLASYYYEDRGPQFARVRAVRKDGLQVWQWPRELHKESPRLLGGDFTGGILMTAGEGDRRELFSVDINGRERWRIPVPGKVGRGVNINQLNVILYVVADAKGPRLVGLNGRTGEQVLTVPIDPGTERRRNLEISGGRIICAPGVDTVVPSSLRITPVITNVVGVTNIAYTQMSIAADAGLCAAGAPVVPADVRLHVTQRLVMLDLGQDFMAVHTTIEQSEGDTTAAAGVEMLAPLKGSMIVGPNGEGNYLGLRNVLWRWPTADESTRQAFVYRLTSNRRRPMYRVTLPPGDDFDRVSLLLGDGNNPAYVAYGHTVMAFETADGRERWRYTSSTSKLIAEASLKGDTMMVREGKRYTVLNAGRPVDTREQMFMLFVMRYVPNLDEDE